MSIKLNSQQTELVDNHVLSQITADLKPYYKKFVPTIIEKIESIIAQVLENIKTHAKTNPHSYSWSFNTEDLNLSISNEDLKLLKTIFAETIEVFASHTTVLSSNRKPNSLSQVFNSSSLNSMTALNWTPNNPYVYAQEARRYQYTPAANSMTLYQSALTGKETDFKIKSSQDSESVINAHSLILKLNSDYFESLLNSGLKESDKKTITLDYSPKVLKNMVEFIYCGQIAQSNALSLDDLLELLALSHMIQMTSLFNHTLDLIDDFLKKDMTLNPEQIKNMLASASYFDQEHLTIFALKAADESPSLDWDNFPKDLIPKLLIKASFHKLERLEETLSQFITKGLHLADASA